LALADTFSRRAEELNEQKRITGMLSVVDLSHAGERESCGEVLDEVAACVLRGASSVFRRALSPLEDVMALI
jgi:hypothetical protein